MRTPIQIVAVLCLVALAGGCKSPLDTAKPAAATSGTKQVMPNLVGQRLPAAKSTLDGLGIGDVSTEDGSGRDRSVIDDANWVVTGEKPKVGTPVTAGTAVTLLVGRPSDGYHPGPLHFGTVPRLVCMNLQDAEEALVKSGLPNLRTTDGSGQGRFQVLDADWLVTAQSVPAGSTPGVLTRVVLTVVKYGEPTGTSGCPS
jgi:hypothetical protein